MTELVLFVALVALVAAVGVALGMLIAPHLGRWAARDDDEGDGGSDD